jgi:hypothetical protein
MIPEEVRTWSPLPSPSPSPSPPKKKKWTMKEPGAWKRSNREAAEKKKF